MNQSPLEALRLWMSREDVDGWLDTGEDPHGSEYPPERWRTRQILSGFSGSAGLLAVTAGAGALATDSRYWLQAPRELVPGLELVRSEGGLDKSLQEWLQGAVPGFKKLAADPGAVNAGRWRAWAAFCRSVGAELVAAPGVWDKLWPDRPGLPEGMIRDYEPEWSVEGRLLKLDRLRGAMSRAGASACLIGALDEVSWLLNLRGSDIHCNPLFLSWLLVEAGRVVLYAQEKAMEPGLPERLKRDGVELRPYEAVGADLPENLEGWMVASHRVPASLLLGRVGLEDRLMTPFSPVASLKAVKSPAELDGFREAMRRDGRAYVRFLRWWESLGLVRMTEGGVAEKLWRFRSEEGAWIPSFDTIAGWKSNGAIVHYNPGEAGAEISDKGLLLLDSGAHYAMGTTDITRVLVRGQPEPEWVDDYTAVLRAYLAVAMTRFPAGTKGYQIDALARGVLWREGMNYGHGTGHGVGHVLSVHEGPQKLSPDNIAVALEPGMVVSHEPGLYREGGWGIRLENLAAAVPEQANQFGSWMVWETLTLAPFEPLLVDFGQLTAQEKTWLAHYHLRVQKEVSPGLAPEDADWLAFQIQPWLEQARQA